MTPTSSSEFRGEKIPLRRKLIGAKEKWLIVPLLAVAFVLLHLFTGYGCIFRWLFGTICPGCGYTRAVFYALRLDFGTAWHYHPLFWTFPLFVLYFLRDGRITGRKRTDIVIPALVVAMFFIVWIIRLSAGVSL